MCRQKRQQRGAALVVGLVLLLVLTLLAVSTMRTASLELLMAGNAQYRENAFRLAEAGIADAIGQVSAPGATSSGILLMWSPASPVH